MPRRYYLRCETSISASSRWSFRPSPPVNGQTEDVYEEPKELFVFDGGAYFELYDKPEYVELAVAKVGRFFQARL